MSEPREPGLTDVPETMLWTLHSRAVEAMRPDSVFPDAKAVEIYQSLDYDFERSFGRSNPMAALRARMFDRSVSTFIAENPGGSIVNLGEGLETQRYRISDDSCAWYTVDLPAAIEIRERFIAPDERHTHITLSATDRAWMDRIPEDRPVLIAAQGLFMYFQEQEVRGLLNDIAARFPQCQLVFDVIPYWVSRASVLAKGLPLTRHYRTPVMPWGVHRFSLRTKLKGWVRRPCNIDLVDYPRFPRGALRLVSWVVPMLPGARHWVPLVAEIQLL
ncbi:MAG: O-methyltransferase involved in polyketide biosynthesis [Glaciecola sp.]|jgi:O-methyltransferase involved in polyketide biosynthesis|uniref:class I SAM-dependent methyltransferase n=1 Tax=Congregibacter sp. TaxID=2744308 RepID=UPI0039E6C70E